MASDFNQNELDQLEKNKTLSDPKLTENNHDANKNLKSNANQNEAAQSSFSSFKMN